MVRKLIALLVFVGGLGSQQANALGLGQIELTSALNEPLAASIPLRNVGDLSDGQLLVGLASKEDFERAGVDRPFFLSELKFTVNLDGAGNGVIAVSSKKPIKEPYIDFVLEVRWPTGRVIREYTALLDLPVFTDETPVAVAAPARKAPVTKAKPAPEPRPAAQPARKPASVAAAPKPKPPAPVEREPETAPEQANQGVVDDTDENRQYGPTRSNDTLWRIAQRVRASDEVSIQQTMLALQRLNPEAFINGNINLLKVGKVLRVPTVEEVRDVTRQQAYREVASQNQQWRTEPEAEPASAPQLDATSEEIVEADPMPIEEEGHLELASVDPVVESDTASGSGSEAEEGGAEVGVSGQAIESLENEMAISLENLERAKRENDELSSRLDDMQGQIETLQRLIALKDDELAALQAGAAGQAPDGTRAVPGSDETGGDKPSGQETSGGETSGLLGLLLGNSLYLAIIAGTGVFLLVALLVAKRRREEDLPDLETAQAVESPSYDEAGVASIAAIDNDIEEAEDQPAPDILGEADIYIAYGRHEQAIEMLSKAIAEEPRRSDYHVKALEVYIDVDDQAGFSRQYEDLHALGDADAESRVSTMLSNAGLSHWLDEGAQFEQQEDDASGADDLRDTPLQDLSELEQDDTVDAESTLEEALASEDFELDIDESLLESEDSTEAEAKDDLGLGDDDLSDIDDEIAAIVEDDPEFEVELDEKMLGDDSDDEPDDQAVSEQAQDAEISLDSEDLESELEMLEDGDEMATKLDLARAYIEMGDNEGARDILEEVLNEGADQQKDEASELLGRIA
jgi:pilus assembly protein FimV